MNRDPAAPGPEGSRFMVVWLMPDPAALAAYETAWAPTGMDAGDGDTLTRLRWPDQRER